MQATCNRVFIHYKKDLYLNSTNEKTFVMKKLMTFLTSLILILSIGCNQPIQIDKNKESSSIKELVTTHNFTVINSIPYSDVSKFFNDNREIITFMINDSIQVTKDLYVVFYSYHLYLDTIKKVDWVREINNKYFLSHQYFYFETWGNSIPVDLKNIDKKVLEDLDSKKDKWIESSADVWWN